jgi:phage shock protein PspC (stress-responsive transcriptional regulator)
MSTVSEHQILVERIEKHLERRSYPRMQMMVIVSLTGASGLLTSAGLLRIGVLDMAGRYPVSVLIAYCVFLSLLWLWIRKIAADFSNLTPAQLDAEEALAAQSATQQPSVPLPAANPSDPVGSLGAVQGLSAHDAQARINIMDSASQIVRFVSDILSRIVEGIFQGIGKLLGDADELVIPIMVVLLFLGLAFASVYVVATAPALFAEVLVDSTLSYTLYKRLVRTEERNWLRAAITRTLWPLAGTLVLVTFMGFVLGSIAPGAHTISEALACTPPVPTGTASP